TFGTGSNAQQPSSNTGGLFSSQNTANTGGLFSSQNTANTRGLFSSQNTANTGGLFSSQNTANTGGLFSSQNTANTGGLFSSQNTANTGGLFSNQNKGNTGGLFSNQNAASTGGLFSSQNNTNSGGLFGSSNQQNTSGSLFGNQNNLSSNLLQPSTNFSQNTQNNTVDNTRLATSNPVLYGNFKDHHIAKLNQLKAFHGHGRVFYVQNGYVDLNQKSDTCGFKTIVYNSIPIDNQDENILIIVFQMSKCSLLKKIADLKSAILGIIGKFENISVCFKQINEISENQCSLEFYIIHLSSDSTPSTISSDNILNFFQQSSQAKVLKDNFNAINLFKKPQITISEIKAYLNSSPEGIDILQWQKACKNNPDDKNLIPHPIYGFKELKHRCESHFELKKSQDMLIKHLRSRIGHLKQVSEINHQNITDFNSKLSLVRLKLVVILAKLMRFLNPSHVITENDDNMFLKLDYLFESLKSLGSEKFTLNQMLEHLRNAEIKHEPIGEEKYNILLGKLIENQKNISELSKKIEQ
ncbi:MAG: Nuclear pore complex protein Nup54, partial [Paramarteilia canceri]